jgi:outer membrane protein assembly factor BamB
MEWRGGMVPHIGLASSGEMPANSSSAEAEPLRKITGDWSQFRGPQRDGHVPLPSDHQPFAGLPTPRWNKACGAGHSSIITHGQQVITLEQRGDRECLTARHLSDGSDLWEVSENTRWDDMMSGEGPRSTPTLANGKIYSLFSNGLLACVDPEDGRTIWKTTVIEEGYDFPEWGISASPLIWKNQVIVNPGGESGAVKSYSAQSGQLLWQSQLSGRGVYLSPTILPLLGEDHLITAVTGKIVSLDPHTGMTRWEHPWKIFLNNAQIVQPIALSGNSFLLAAGYGKGAECISLSRAPETDAYLLESQWTSKDLKAKFSNPVLKDGYLYGFSENLLVCLEAGTGHLKWRGKKYGYGRILVCGEQLIILGNTGVLSVVDANPENFREVFSAPLLSDTRCWNGPALVNGYLIARNGEEIACFDWRK